MYERVTQGITTAPNTHLDRLELVMGSEVGYGLRKPLAAEDMGYMLGVCLEKEIKP